MARDTEGEREKRGHDDKFSRGTLKRDTRQLPGIPRDMLCDGLFMSRRDAAWLRLKMIHNALARCFRKSQKFYFDATIFGTNGI